MYGVSCEVWVSAAHRLQNYQGKCYNWHGHNYKIEVFCRKDNVDDRGILVDFAALTEVVKKIVEPIDHSMIIIDNQQNRDFIEMLLKFVPYQRVYWITFESTAENLAKHIYELIKQYQMPVVKVKVWETINHSARYSEEEIK